MGGSLGVDIVEGENFFVFINFAAGNDPCGNFTEKAVFHKIMLLSKISFRAEVIRPLCLKIIC
jgi:hypothetical protein